MQFTITIPQPKAGKPIPTHIITKEDTIKILGFSIKPDGQYPVALAYEVKIVNEEKEVVEEHSVTVAFNEETQLYESPVLDMVYNGTTSFFYITGLYSDELGINTLLAPIALDALLLRESDNGGGRIVKNRPVAPKEVV